MVIGGGIGRTRFAGRASSSPVPNVLALNVELIRAAA
jgi:hypothetical protein